MKKISPTILFLTLTISALGQRSDRKTIFNGILIGQEKYILSPQTLKYGHKMKKKFQDSTVYSFDFPDVTGVAADNAEMLITKNQVFIGPYLIMKGDSNFQKMMDLGLKAGEQWTANNLFCFNKSTITFEIKYFDNIPNDTIYQFKVDGDGLCSHANQVRRIYGTKKLGLVRLDYLLSPSHFDPSPYNKAIFVSSDYLKRSKLKSFYKNVLLNDPG